MAATGRLDILSRERVREELLKVLGGDPNPRRALELYRASGVLEAVTPELAAMVGHPLPGGVTGGLDVWKYAVAMAETLPASRVLLRVAALMQGLGLPDPSGNWRSDVAAERAAALMIRLRFSNSQIERVTGLVRAGPTPPAETDGASLRRWLARVGPDRLPELARLWIARARVSVLSCGERGSVGEVWRALRSELRRGPPLTIADLALGGRDLMRLGMKPGPHFGEVLERLLDRVLEDPTLNRSEALAALVLEWESRDDAAGPAS